MRPYLQHGRRHGPAGTDPIIPAGIYYDFANVGDWLQIYVTGEGATDPNGSTTNGIVLYTAGGISGDHGGIRISDGDFDAPTDESGGITITEYSQGGITITDLGEGGLSGIDIAQNGHGNITVSTGGTGGINIGSNGGGVGIKDSKGGGVSINSQPTGSGDSGIHIEEGALGDGGILLRDRGSGGITIDTFGSSSGLFLFHLPTSAPAGSLQVWNNSGVLHITP